MLQVVFFNYIPSLIEISIITSYVSLVNMTKFSKLNYFPLFFISIWSFEQLFYPFCNFYLLSALVVIHNLYSIFLFGS